MSLPSVSHIRGVIPAMFSTFNSYEEVDLKRAGILVNFLIDQGVHGLYITGSTGEGFLMTDDERKTFTEVVIRETDGRVPVVVHVGAIGTRRTIELAQHAEAAGADAISSVPPFYYQFSQDNVFGYYKDVSDSVHVPMIVYNIAFAGLMDNSLVGRLTTIKGVRGLKFTGKNHDDMSMLKQELGSDFMIYSGSDEMAAQGLLAGADGIIGSFYNLLPDTFLEIYRLAQEGDYVRAFEIQKLATTFIKFTIKWDFYGIMKQCLTDTGVDAGFVRRPFTHPDAQVMDEVWAYCESLKASLPDTHMSFMYRRKERAAVL